MNEQFAVFCELWCTSLMHFVWQAFVIAGFVAIALRVGQNISKNAKYLVVLFGLVTSFVMPFVNVILLCEPPVEADTTQPSMLMLAVDRGSDIVDEEIRMETTIRESMSIAPIVDRPSATWIYQLAFTLWCVGVAWSSMRIIGGTHYLRKIQKSTYHAGNGERDILIQIARRLRLSYVPALRISKLTTNAFVFGIWKPCIVMPACWMTELNPEMLSAVIAHELAHVRRHDLWVNFFQRTAEMLFFFHPAVWWISRQITKYREMCCDQVAAELVQNRGLYARTLERLATFYQQSNRFSLAANLGDDRMSMLHRVQNVLGQKNAHTTSGIWPLGVIAILVPIFMSAADTTKMDAQELNHSNYYRENATERAPSDAESPSIDSSGLADNSISKSAAFRVAQRDGVAPTESSRISLPAYRMAPPDVLLIQSVRLIPKDNYGVRAGDILEIVVANAMASDPIAGQFRVAEDGTITLGAKYGSVKVGGLKIDEVQREIKKRLQNFIAGPKISLSVLQAKGQNAVSGEHLIAPDGTINLGVFGTSYVAGMTVDEARSAVEKQLSNYFSRPKVSVNVMVYNSKYYYIITEGEELGDQIVRIPITGNETVLDGIAQIGGLQAISNKKIWISRPGVSGQEDLLLEVDYPAITRGAATETNYQIFPGDRIFISNDSSKNSVNPRPLHKKVTSFNVLLKEGRWRAAKRLANTLLENHPNDPAVQLMVAHSNLLSKVNNENTQTTHFRSYRVNDLLSVAPHELIIKKGETRHVESTDKINADHESLINLIKSTIAPDSWDDVGGTGSMKFFTQNQSLVVQSTQDIHEQVAELLSQLRKMKSHGISLEWRHLQVGSQDLKRLGLNEKQVAILSRSEAQAVLDLVQDDPHSRVFEPSTNFVLSGQLTKFILPQKNTEATITSQLVIADREFLRGTIGMPGYPGVNFLAKNGAFILCKFATKTKDEDAGNDFFLMKISITEQKRS